MKPKDPLMFVICGLKKCNDNVLNATDCNKNGKSCRNIYTFRIDMSRK